jgi:6-phosphogluconolactonase
MNSPSSGPTRRLDYDRLLIHDFPDIPSLVKAIAVEWARRLADVPSGNKVGVALSGGRITPALLGEIGAADSTGKLRLLDYFWADERLVPPEDAESNFGQVHSTFFERFQIPSERIHRIPGESPEAAATVANEDLAKWSGTGEKIPILDWVFLGMGEDGHVASLFPGETRNGVNGPAAYCRLRGPKPPPDRVTLSYPAIVAARNVWVVISGKGKEWALEESLRNGGNTPLAEVLRRRKTTELWISLQA